MSKSIRALIESANERRKDAEGSMIGEDATTASVFFVASIADSLLALALIQFARLEQPGQANNEGDSAAPQGSASPGVPA